MKKMKKWIALILMKDGKELKRLSGLQQKPLIVKMLEEQM